ncbi:hypothetical protein ABZY90_19820 [Streptomyces sp. NPDC006422]|uniref:hypothetical protein n=1 Tax=unclassified Streptomyces TaxID=2593676 RepID=UPI0033B127E3
MSPAERRRLLGDRVIDHIRQEVAAAPSPDQQLIDTLRRILRGAAAKPAPRRAA